MQCHVTMTASQAVYFVVIYMLKNVPAQDLNVSFWLTLLGNLGLKKPGN